MTDVKLIYPTKEYEKEAYEYMQEFLKYNFKFLGADYSEVVSFILVPFKSYTVYLDSIKNEKCKKKCHSKVN